jgi:hypothetical protein
MSGRRLKTIRVSSAFAKTPKVEISNFDWFRFGTKLSVPAIHNFYSFLL